MVVSCDSISSFGEELLLTPQQGDIIFELKDVGGKMLSRWTRHNLITLDAGVLAARLLKTTLLPTPGRNNGLVMMAVGTGGVTIDEGQRKLEVELTRKAFLSVQYVDGGGFPSAVPTSIMDFQSVFGPGEAEGLLNEMGLLYTESLNPLVTNPINNGPYDYDPDIDVTGKDLLANYLAWDPPSPKPPFTILTLTWQVQF